MSLITSSRSLSLSLSLPHNFFSGSPAALCRSIKATATANDGTIEGAVIVTDLGAALVEVTNARKHVGELASIPSIQSTSLVVDELSIGLGIDIPNVVFKWSIDHHMHITNLVKALAVLFKKPGVAHAGDDNDITPQPQPAAAASATASSSSSASASASASAATAATANTFASTLTAGANHNNSSSNSGGSPAVRPSTPTLPSSQPMTRKRTLSLAVNFGQVDVTLASSPELAARLLVCETALQHSNTTATVVMKQFCIFLQRYKLFDLRSVAVKKVDSATLTEFAAFQNSEKIAFNVIASPHPVTW